MNSCRRFKSIWKYQLNDKKFNRLKHFMITENWNQLHHWSTFHLKHKFYATFKYFSNSTGLWFLFSSPLFTVPSRLHRWLWVTAVQDCGEMGRRKSLTQSLRMNTWPFIFFLFQFEERLYPGNLKWVCTSKSGPKYSEDLNSVLFKRLYGYISGGNKQSMK